MQILLSLARLTLQGFSLLKELLSLGVESILEIPKSWSSMPPDWFKSCQML